MESIHVIPEPRDPERSGGIKALMRSGAIIIIPHCHTEAVFMDNGVCKSGPEDVVIMLE